MRNLRYLILALPLLAIAPALIAQAGPASSTSPATLKAGDIIKIAVWREPDLSGEFVVNESGVVTLPLLGKINVLSIPIDQLSDRLIERYSAELQNPSITVTPLRRIYVLGEVSRPGVFTVDPTITIAGAIALAGGATSNGDVDRLRVIRNGEVILNEASLTASLTAVNIRSDDQVFVDRRGWFDRNSTFAASALISIATLVLTLIRR